MRRILATVSIVMLALLLPRSSFAAALCGAAGAAPTSNVSYGGLVSTHKAICLCDGAANCAPTGGPLTSFDYDLTSMGLLGTGSVFSLGNRLTTSPDLVIFERNLVAGCAGNLTASFLTGPDADTLHTLGVTSAIDVTTTRLVVDLQRAPLDRFLNVALTNTAGCADSEIIMLYEEVER